MSGTRFDSMLKGVSTIGGTPDAKTNKHLSRWSLDGRDRRYRVSAMTVHLDELRSGVISFTPRSPNKAGTLKLRHDGGPLPLAAVASINMPGLETYVEFDPLVAGLAHLHAMARVGAR